VSVVADGANENFVCFSIVSVSAVGNDGLHRVTFRQRYSPCAHALRGHEFCEISHGHAPERQEYLLDSARNYSKSTRHLTIAIIVFESAALKTT